MCDACGKQFATSHAFDKHRTRPSGYLRGTACLVLDDGSTRTQLVATSRPTMSTATLHEVKLSGRSHGTTMHGPPTGPRFKMIWIIKLLFSSSSRNNITEAAPRHHREYFAIFQQSIALTRIVQSEDTLLKLYFGFPAPIIISPIVRPP